MMSWIVRSAFNTTTQLVAWVLSNRCLTSSGMDAFDIFVHHIKSTIECKMAHYSNSAAYITETVNYDSVGYTGYYTLSQKNVTC